MLVSTNRRRPARAAFTLIELLVSIGILLIVSAIALQNVSEAQTRAKVSRVKGDLRTLATAIEAYTADHNAPARMRHYRFYNDLGVDYLYGQGVKGLISPCLSTPVAYVGSSLIRDVFMESERLAPVDVQLYTYQDLLAYRENDESSEFWPDAIEFYGQWRLGSVGPDRRYEHNFSKSAQLPYDPTNGTVSLGNIWRGQKVLEGALPKMPDLVGAH